MDRYREQLINLFLISWKTPCHSQIGGRDDKKAGQCDPHRGGSVNEHQNINHKHLDYIIAQIKSGEVEAGLNELLEKVKKL